MRENNVTWWLSSDSAILLFLIQKEKWFFFRFSFGLLGLSIFYLPVPYIHNGLKNRTYTSKTDYYGTGLFAYLWEWEKEIEHWYNKKNT